MNKQIASFPGVRVTVTHAECWPGMIQVRIDAEDEPYGTAENPMPLSTRESSAAALLAAFYEVARQYPTHRSTKDFVSNSEFAFKTHGHGCLWLEPCLQ